jgi:ferredoxin
LICGYNRFLRNYQKLQKGNYIMPKLTVAGNTVEVAAGKRLVLAIKEAGVNIGHRCGGNARCTTCRVKFESGEPTAITKAEKEKLEESDLAGQYRLACQLECQQDMSLTVEMTLENHPDWKDTGPQPKDEITPEPEWV